MKDRRYNIGLQGELCQRYIRKYPKSSKRTIARILHEEQNEHFPTFESARGLVKYYTGGDGEVMFNKLKDKSMVRPKDFNVEMPKSKYEKWLPYIIKTKEGLKAAIFADCHLPYHDEIAVNAMLDRLDIYKPDVLILDGDIADVYTLSYFQKDPKKRDLHGEMKIVAQFLKHLQERYKCDIYYKLGNHEERWDRFFWTHPDFCEMSFVKFQNVIEKEYGVEGVNWVTNKRIIHLGNLPIVHGHEWMRSFNNPVNPARGAFLKTLSDVLVAHLHQTSDHEERTMDGRLIVTRSIGCLCGLNPEYAPLNKWAHSYAEVIVHLNGHYKFDMMRIFEGEVFCR